MERNKSLGSKTAFNSKQLFKMYILSRLVKGESIYGNLIYEDLKSLFKTTFFSPSYSVIYDTLHKLEYNNYIASSWTGSVDVKNRQKRIYKITDKGIMHYNSTVANFVDDLKSNKYVIEKFISLLS